jgi:hypothetical protein
MDIKKQINKLNINIIMIEIKIKICVNKLVIILIKYYMLSIYQKIPKKLQ